MKEVYLYATLGELKKISDGLDYLYESPTDPDDEFYMNN